MPFLYIVVICIIYCNRYCYDNSIYWIDIVIHYKILFVYNLKYWGFSLIRFQVHGTDLFTFFIFLLSIICCGVLFGMHDQGVFQSMILSEYLQDHDVWTWHCWFSILNCLNSWLQMIHLELWHPGTYRCVPYLWLFKLKLMVPNI